MSRPDLLARLAKAAHARELAGLTRHLQTVERMDGAHVEIGGRRCLGFRSNDYLGLAQHPEVVAALRDAANMFGVGSTGAHLICGHQRAHAELEQALAEWTGRDRALLFSCGVMANAGTLQALLGRGDVCVQDRLNHASLIDAARASGALLKRYPHASVDGARQQLASMPDAAAILASDGVFSMDGDVAPLAALATLASRQNVTLMIDDAHGLGVLGADGAGSVVNSGLKQKDVPILMATLGKALGCAGAFVAGPAALIEGLTQFARSYVYTTAMPPALAGAALAALKMARTQTWRRDKLHALIERFRQGAAQLALPLLDSQTPIQPLVFGDTGQTMAAARTLQDAGVLVSAIRPPTVPQGQARLRITLSAAHEEGDIDRLLSALETLPTRYH